MESEGVKRKLTTILAADVVEYSRLMRADEEGTLKTLGEFREIIDGLIARHDGRVFSTGGDSVLAEFSSAVEAVRCAISFQEEISSRNAELTDDRKLMFRIGINVGDVMVRDGDLFGDGVNVAARLEGLAEAGGVCVSGSVFEQIKHKLSLGFEDMGQQEVKNIAEPVSAYRLVAGPLSVSAGATVAARPRAARRWRMRAISTAVVVVILAVGGLAVWQPWAPQVEPASIARMAFPLPEKPSIAVLAFTNMSDDASQAYFADGMAEDIITDLSKISGLFVIARNSSFAYREKQVDVRTIARELGVRYVLEGSVRRAGEEVRINAQLVDASTGGHLWAERYDGKLADVFDLQDEVTSKIVAALAVELKPVEQQQTTSRETDSPEAYVAFLKGWERYLLRTPEDSGKAISAFISALEFDPGYGRAHAALAATYWSVYVNNWSHAMPRIEDEWIADFDTHTVALKRARNHLKLAYKDPTSLAYQVTSHIDAMEYRHDEALTAAERALDLDANDSENLVAMAAALIWAGRSGDAIPLVERAMRRDPRHPSRYLHVLGLARFALQQWQDTVILIERGLKRNPEELAPLVPLAAAYAQMGREDEAKASLGRLLEPYRLLSHDVRYWMRKWPFRDAATVERLGSGLVKAGLCCQDEVAEFIDRMRANGKLR